jgi:hypothetical protein
MILALNGLESIQRFAAGSTTLTADQLASADRDNQARAVRDAPPATYTVKRIREAPAINGRDNDWEGIGDVVIARTGFPLKGRARIAYDDAKLYLCFTVQDPSPWINEGKEYSRLFKSGDAVDLQLCTDPQAASDAKRRNPGAGDLRVVFSLLDGKPVAVLMRPVDPAADPALAVDYVSPVSPKHFDRVQVLASAEVAVTKNSTGYTVEAALPLAVLGLKPVAGLVLRGDVGFISSDASGTINAARTYWANKDTNLVSDLPQEAWFNPAVWGTLAFE